MNLKIIYTDESIVAINKPHGLLVHRSKYADNATEFAVQKLRNQLERYVYPCHRIDRKTAGVLLFALNETTLSEIQQQFAQNKIKKKYLAIVRGYTDDSGIIDYPLINDKGKTQEAITHYKTLSRAEINTPQGKFTTSRYSMLELQPQTGRMHQIRKHLAHIFHPIIGDRPHGCNKQNKLFKERWDMNTMMLHAIEIHFNHPETKKDIRIKAEIQTEFKRVIKLLALSFPIS